jgi:hypothetical protein
MNWRALTFGLAFGALIAGPALAQVTIPGSGPPTPPPTAPTPSPVPAAPSVLTTTQATFDSLVAEGYEIKAVNTVSDAAIKEIWPNQTLSSQVFISLQKGNSVAVCEMATAAWIGLLENILRADTTRCTKR